MNRIFWIIKEMYRDLIKNYKWVLKGAGLVMAMIAIMKVLIFFNLGDIFLPLKCLMVEYQVADCYIIVLNFL